MTHVSHVSIWYGDHGDVKGGPHAAEGKQQAAAKPRGDGRCHCVSNLPVARADALVLVVGVRVEAVPHQDIVVGEALAAGHHAAWVCRVSEVRVLEVGVEP